MSNLEQACRLSNEKWIESLPKDIPEHIFSEKHNEKMQAILTKTPAKDTKTKHKFSKKTVRLLLIAAIIMSFTTTVFAIPSSRKYIVNKFTDHSEYSVSETSKAQNVTSLKVNYIPSGFEKTEEDEVKDDFFYTYKFVNERKYFYVTKYSLNADVEYDTEFNNTSTVKIKSAEGIIFKPSYDSQGIIFNNGIYIYVIEGNINNHELVNIAQNVE